MFTLGRYELFDAIGSGGMATVHLARSRGAGGFSRVVAIKRLNPELAHDPDFVAMFVDEARVASRIRHPNVVQVFDVVSLEGELFLVLEYVAGEPLARLLATAALPPPVAVALMIGVLDGLHAAHEARDESGRALQIVHRDVSPQNVLVGADGIAHLLDFGIAKAMGRSHVTRDGALKGKVPYMAPEQLRGEAVTRAADVYAASVTLWETLTGQRLFASDDQAALVVEVLSAPVRPPSAVAPGIPAALDAVVMRGLDRERTRRFPTAAAMARALEQALAPASAIVVSDWLASCAGPALEARARLVATVESAPLGAEVRAAVAEHTRAEHDATATAASLPSPPARTPKRRRRSLVGGVIGLAVVAVAVALLAHGAKSNEPPPPREVGTAPATAIEPPSTLAPPVEPSPAPAPAPNGMSAEARRPRAPSSRTTVAPHVPAARSSKGAGESCDPPYTLEGDHKVWKRSCL